MIQKKMYTEWGYDCRIYVMQVNMKNGGKIDAET